MPPADPSFSSLLAIVGLTAAVGLASALAASVFVALPDRVRRTLVPHLVSFATGALLGAALIGLLPAAIKGAGLWNGPKIGLALLAGLLLFFLLEKLVLWHHCHDEDAHAPTHDEDRRHATGRMILWGDAFHNLLDGVLIAAAYLTNPALGVATAIAVFTHELPTEIGDVAVLLHSGMGRLQALLVNALVSLAAVLGGVIAFYALGSALKLLPYALAFAAASLLYVALADLIPALHRSREPKSTALQVLLILLGLGAIWLSQPPSSTVGVGLSPF